MRTVVLMFITACRTAVIYGAAPAVRKGTGEMAGVQTCEQP